MKYLDNTKDLPVEGTLREEGVNMVRFIRCMKHFKEPQLNSEAAGDECGVCIAENCAATWEPFAREAQEIAAKAIAERDRLERRLTLAPYVAISRQEWEQRWMSIGHHPKCDQSHCDDEPPTPACTCPYWWHDAFPLIDELVEEIRVLCGTLEECADIYAENTRAKSINVPD